MTQQDQELLSRYLDGELDATQSNQLELRLNSDPQLQSSLERMQQLNKTLKSAFNTPRARTVPARIISMLTKPALAASENHVANDNIVPFPGRQRKTRWSFALAASIMAASGLLLVQGTGQQLAGTSTGSDPLLAQELENASSRGEGWDILSDGRQVRPLLTFSHIEGRWCREFLLADEGANWRGVACRQDDGNWSTEVLGSQGPSQSSGEYRTAGAGDSDEVAQYIGYNAGGVALSAAKEEELIASKWH